ncbi:hypothetical protein SASPL_103686 [Salvia splendens]|uniref:SANT domain-containing protein n=2 Tax=Salvia splendens TaxID=180675 RepID=A0A8X8YK61_SALSN|nr:hypothetical protein SASPL_103686 [Salvia splendens]
MENHVASSLYDTFGEPKIAPRVGNEYQAELPQVLGDSNTLCHSMDCADDETRADSLQNFDFGSSIKLAWISSEQSGMRGSLDWMDEIDERSGKNYRLVPESCDECWSEAEKGCFLLGLYIFAKNFVEIKKFVGTKDMVAVQSYYYGTFYSSPEYHRWYSAKHKRCKLGRGLFYGLRLQEFLSRVLPRVGESQNALLEVSKSFENEKISVAEYAFLLKAMIGTELLVEAVGIGREHQDLTAMATRHSKTRHDMPSENVYTSLTTAEISNLLSGEHRLSKARSNDLFWEAVWPRLLASGWHSEEATNYRDVASSNASPSLVFLIPGVKRFSRRELVRGDQYFDTVADVLRKVAREPALLELELDQEGVGCSNKVEQCGLANDENHCSFSITVVDTGLPDGKVVEFRTFPSAAEIGRETPDEATILGKKRGHDAMALDEEARPTSPDARTALVHKKRTTRGQNEDEVSKNVDILPSTSSSSSNNSSSSIEEKQPQFFIDLNLPPESEQDIITSKNNLETASSNQTRFSTRRRPPTMRVLEAFAHGYLSVNKKQKKKEDGQ